MALTAQLTHFGIHTVDLACMVDFYTRVMGFVISDQGVARSGANIVFMTQDPQCHHQFVLFDGRPQDQTYSPVNQISLRLDSLDTLKSYRKALIAEGDHRAPRDRSRKCLGALLQGSRRQPGRALLRYAILHAPALRRAARSRSAERRDPETYRSDVSAASAFHVARSLDGRSARPARRTPIRRLHSICRE